MQPKSSTVLADTLKKIAVFASGSGSNFQSLINAVDNGSLEAKICGLIVSRMGIKSIERAESNNIPIHLFESEEILNQVLGEWEPDLIVLAGYLKLIPTSTIRKFENRIVNIHPSLLPKYGGKGYYGIKVHEAVINNGDKISGCTVHYVNEIYDEGPVIAQSTVEVFEEDTAETLAKRVLEQEHLLLPEVVTTLISEL